MGRFKTPVLLLVVYLSIIISFDDLSGLYKCSHTRFTFLTIQLTERLDLYLSMLALRSNFDTIYTHLSHNPTTGSIYCISI